jgi:hypothetical protein
MVEVNNKRLDLMSRLFDMSRELQARNTTSIKEYEIAFQDVIEEVFPEKCWWETTDCEIFMHLLEHKNPDKTIFEIINRLKEK